MDPFPPDTIPTPELPPPAAEITHEAEVQSFFPPAPIEKKEWFSDRIRNIFAVSLIVLSATATFLFLETEQKPWRVVEAWSHIDIAGILERHNIKIGGDISIPPPLPLPPPIPKLVGLLPEPEKFTAQAILVKDLGSSEVLYQKNEYEKRPLASITKLLSALVLLEQDMDWASTTTITKDTDIADSNLITNNSYTLEDLWKAGLVASSNKAILALVDSTGLERSAFVQRMNEKALELGMIDSSFEEATGLSQNNISTASDISLLLDEALKQPKIQKTLLLKEINISPLGSKKKQHIWNTNWILLGWVPNKITDFQGGKTGYIPASGYNFTMQVGTGDKVMDIVVLGSTQHEFRFSEARDVLNLILSAYHWPSDDVSASSTSSTGMIAGQ